MRAPTATHQPGAQPVRILAPAEYKARVRSRFASRADRYDVDDRFHPRVAHNVVRTALLEAGHSVLDIATGTGLVALEAAEVVCAEGSVVGLDISPEMIDKAARKAAEKELNNIRFILGDVEEHSFPQQSFDRALSANAVPYFQHFESTFNRIHGWLKPGGRFVFDTPQSPMFAPSNTLNVIVAEVAGILLQDAAAQVGNQETVEALLQGAGFSNVEVIKEADTYVFPGTFPSQFAEQLWTLSSTFPMAPLHLALDQQQLEMVKRRFIAEVTRQGEAMQRGSDIVNPFTHMYIVASA